MATAAIVGASPADAVPLDPVGAEPAIVGVSPASVGASAAAKSSEVSWSSGGAVRRSTPALLNVRVGGSIGAPQDGQRDANAFTTAPQDGQGITGG